jgi:hypothetical protein
MVELAEKLLYSPELSRQYARDGFFSRLEKENGAVCLNSFYLAGPDEKRAWFAALYYNLLPRFEGVADLTREAAEQLRLWREHEEAHSLTDPRPGFYSIKLVSKTGDFKDINDIEGLEMSWSVIGFENRPLDQQKQILLAPDSLKSSAATRQAVGDYSPDKAHRYIRSSLSDRQEARNLDKDAGSSRPSLVGRALARFRQKILEKEVEHFLKNSPKPDAKEVDNVLNLLADWFLSGRSLPNAMSILTADLETL